MRYSSLFAGPLAVLLFAFSQPLAAAPPNILLIVSDDQGYHDLGSCGNDTILTPNLDRLAEQGVRLTSFYVTWPACTPSRGSLLTGRYPQRNGTYDMFRNDVCDFGVKLDAHRYAVSWENVGGMDTREILLPAVLKRAGYVSGIFGKWDLGQLKRFLPPARGFDDFYGFANTGIDYFTHERYGVPSMRRGNDLTEEDKGRYCTDLFAREALRFLDENADQPWFLYVPFNAPHGASNLDPDIRGKAQAVPEYLSMYPEPKGERERHKTVYRACVTHMDAAIGKILDRIDAMGQAANTLVIFLSDNGGYGLSDNGPLRGRKSQLFEGGIRVPCIVRWPDRLPKGHVSDEFLTALEVFPTITAAAGVPLPDDTILDGFDMFPVLKAESPSPRREMFWRRRGDTAARVENWKWVDSSKGTGLFDLETDIGESRDISEERPDVLKMVESRFQAWMKAMEEAEPRGPFRDY